MDPATEAIISATAQIKNSIEQITETLKTWRSITIEITNHSRTFTLVNPRQVQGVTSGVYTRKGYCSNPPQPTIEKGSKEVCTFSSTPEKPCDVYGVLTYQMFTIKQGCVGELAIMFSVPLKYTWHKNWFGVGIFHSGVSCDHGLFNQMYYNDGPFERAK
ncbi:hypothetical protein NFI96_014400, partial [Prochilodus magdalenae]